MSTELAVDCKRWLPSFGNRWLLSLRNNGAAVVAIALLAIWSPATAQPPHGNLGSQATGNRPLPPATKPKPKAKTVPELSLQTLFHPEHQFDYTTSLPTTHWIGRDQSQLLLRQDKTWHQVDPTSGRLSDWPVVEQLQQQLQSLPGITVDQARRSAGKAVTELKHSDDTVLVRIDKSLAIVSTEHPARWMTRDASNWNNATLDPTARRVAYTTDGDLFVVDAHSGRSLRLTDDGTDTILDGVLDWTYQEEIFGRGNFKGFWFSPDGQHLAMLRIDISGIEPYVLPDAASQRGQGIVSRYPKAGDPIPHAALYLWDLRGFESGHVPPPRRLDQSTPTEQRLITGVWWHPYSGDLLWTISDRIQSWRELRQLPVGGARRTDNPPAATATVSTNGDPTVLVREESPAWVEPPMEPGWLADGTLIWRSELPTGRYRLYHLTRGGNLVTPVSPIDLDVRQFAVPADGRFVLVVGDAGDDTVDQHLYRIDLNRATDLNREPSAAVALTDRSGWHNVTISPDCRWAVDQWSDLTTPPQLLVLGTEGERSTVLAESQLKWTGEWIAAEFRQIPAPDGTMLPALLVRPPSATADQPVAVVMEVYGGPQNPMVANRYSGTRSLYRHLLAQRGIATLVVDNRSSAGRAIADSWPIRGQMGKIEFQDVMAAVEWLRDQAWVDDQRLAIRGWSFGGFLTLYAMTHSDAFAAGIAGGSVTQWAEYDAFYTERYMGLPSENASGYESTAPLAAAADLHGQLLLIHGEQDDNVHPSNTLRMAAALQKAGRDFQLMIYPGAAHAVSDPHQAWHLTLMTDRFLSRALGVADAEDPPQTPPAGQKTP